MHQTQSLSQDQAVHTSSSALQSSNASSFQGTSFADSAFFPNYLDLLVGFPELVGIFAFCHWIELDSAMITLAGFCDRHKWGKSLLRNSCDTCWSLSALVTFRADACSGMSTPEEMKQLRSDTLRSIMSTEIEMLPRVRRTHLHTSVQCYFQDARTVFDTLHLKFKVGKWIDKCNCF